MNPKEPKKNILDQLAVFYHRKWLMAVPLIIGTLAGGFLSLYLPEYYSSSTLIVVEEQQVPEEYVMPSDKTPFTQRLNVISQQILSRTKLQQIIKEFGLYQEDGPGAVEKAVRYMRGESAEPPAKDEVIERMRADIVFRVIGEQQRSRGQRESGGNAFTITYQGRDPETTMQVTNKIASLFIEENLKVREMYAEGTSEFLSNELEKAKSALESQERALKAFKETNMGALPEQLDSNLRTLERLDAELQTVVAGIRTNEDRRAFLEEELGKNPAATPQVQTELERLRGELSIMLSMYKETYPDVMILKRRISEIEEQAKRAISRPGEVSRPAVSADLVAVKSQLANLRQREAQIKKQMSDFEKRVEVTPTSEQRQRDLLRDYNTSLTNYQALLEKRMSAQLAENLEKRQKGARFRVIDPANMPESPDRPNKPLVVFLGVFGGAAVGATLVLLFEFVNPAFRRPEDFDGVFKEPVLTSIPIIGPGEKKPEPKLTVIHGRK